MLFAMVTQLSHINLSHMKQVPDYNTLNHGSVPGGFAPSAAPSLTCRQRRGRAVPASQGLTMAANPIMCLGGSERGGSPPGLGHLGCLPLPPQKQLLGELVPMGAAALALGAAWISRREEVFFPFISKIRCHS